MLEDLEQSQNVLQNRLIQSEEYYRLFFNSITDPVCVCRMNPDNTPGMIVEVNNAACEILGYYRTEFLEMELSDLLIEKNTVYGYAGRVTPLVRPRDLHKCLQNKIWQDDPG